MTYCVKQGNTKICSGTASTITVTNVAANETSVSICWVGIITEETNCQPCENEQTFCELIYIGENTSTASTAHTGNIIWHDITIPYSITQKGNTVEPDCESATTTSCITDSYNVWVSPYIVTKEEGGHDIKFYADYSVATIDACGNVINIEKITSSGCPISDSEGLSAKTDFEEAITNKECTDTDRTISAACRLMDIVPCLTSDSAKTVSATCYLQEEEHCCENESGICYEIGEITYSPTSVPFSGGDVYYSFDYKKKTTVNCVTSTKVGTYTSSRPWHISGRTDGEEGQCQRKQVTSSVTPSLDDFITCKSPSSSLTLSIWQGKNTENPECDEITCDECIGYYIDKSTIKQYTYSSNGTWEYRGGKDFVCDFLTYGGQLKVTWEYSAVTKYDDCSSSITSGNTWEDIKQISPCDECYEEGSSDTAITQAIDYVFKNGTAKCFPDDPTFSADSNTFTITYKQEKSKCVQDCPSCMSDGAITLDCGYIPIIDETTGVIIDYTDEISGVTPVTSSTYCNVVSAKTETICNDWLTIEKIGDNFIFNAKSPNSGSSKTCLVTFDLEKKGNVQCTETVSVTQIGSGKEQDESDPEPPIKCPCNYTEGLFFGVYPDGIIPYEGGSPIDVASYGYGDCVSAFTLDIRESSIDWFHDSGITSSTTEGETDGALFGIVDCNCDCENDREFHLDYTYSASGCSENSDSITITQSRNTDCNCNKISSNGVGQISAKGGNSITIGSYTVNSKSCLSDLKIVSKPNWVDELSPLSLDGGNITAKIDCNECSISDRTGDVVIGYKIGNKDCTSSFIVSQKQGPSVTLIPNSEIAYMGGEGIILASYMVSGDDSFTPTVGISPSEGISSLSISNNIITADVDANCCSENPKQWTLTLSYGCSCSKTCEIIQKCGLSGKKIDFDGEDPHINTRDGGTLNLKLVDDI